MDCKNSLYLQIRLETRNHQNPENKYIYLFHGSNTENSREFQKRLLAEIVAINKGEIFVSWQNQVIKDKIKNYEDIYIPYGGNELYAARWLSLTTAKEFIFAVSFSTLSFETSLIFCNVKSSFIHGL